MEKKRLWLVIILALGLFLRFYKLGQKSLWSDEFASLDRAEKSFLEIIKTPELSPPLYYFILHFMVGNFGKSEEILRFPSALAGGLTIYVLYLLGKILFNPEVGLVSAFILSISSFHIHISQEARMYSLAILFSGLMLVFFIKAWLSIPKNRYWIGYLLSALAALYTSHIAIFLISGQFLSLFFMAGERRRENLISFFKSLLAMTLLYIPGLILIINQYTWGRGISFCSRLSLDMLVRLVGIPFHFLAGYLLANPSRMIEVKSILRDSFGAFFVILTVTLSLIIFLLSWRWNKENRVRVRFLWWIFLFPILGIYLIMPGRVAARQLGVSVLPFFVNLALVIRHGYIKKRVIVKILVISLLIINPIALIDYYSRSDNLFAKEDWRLASSFINDNFHPQRDMVFSLRDYYLSDAAKKRRIGNFDREKICGVLKDGGRAWLILDPNRNKVIISELEKLFRGNKSLLEEGPFGDNLRVYILNWS